MLIQYLSKLVKKHKNAVILNYILLIIHFYSPFINLSVVNSNFEYPSTFSSIFMIEEAAFIFDKLQNNNSVKLTGSEQQNVKETEIILEKVAFTNQYYSYKYLSLKAQPIYPKKPFLIHLIPRSPPLICT